MEKIIRAEHRQTHCALQTLSLPDLDLKLRLTGATPAAEFPPLYGFRIAELEKTSNVLGYPASSLP